MNAKIIISTLLITTIASITKLDEIPVTAFDTLGIFSHRLPEAKAISNIARKQNCSEISMEYRKIRTEKAQLLKLIREPQVYLYHCKVRWSLQTKTCSGFIWKSQTPGKTFFWEKYLSIPKEACLQLINRRTANIVFGESRLQLNASMREVVHQEHIIAGEENSDGSCTAGTLYVNRVRETKQIFKILTSTYIDTVQGNFVPGKDVIMVRGGPRINVNEVGYYNDSTIGMYIYNTSQIPKNNCDLYRSIAIGNLSTYTLPDRDEATQVIMNFESRNNLSVTLLQHNKVTICGREAYTTSEALIHLMPLREKDHKVNITEIPKDIMASEIDPFDELSAKLQTIALKISIKINSNIRDIINEICETRRDALRNHYNVLATQAGNGLSLGNGDVGVELINKGAVSFLIFGIPMKATLRQYSSCCLELPIRLSDASFNQTDVFMDARNSIIRPYCTPRSCKGLRPYYYKTSTYNEATYEEKVTWYCTKNSETIISCQEPTEKISLMSNHFKEKIKLDSLTDLTRPALHDPEKLHEHFLSQLPSLAEKSFIAQTAQNLVQQSNIELPMVITHDVDTDEFEFLQAKILSGFGSHFNYYIYVGKVICSIIGFIIIISLSYKMWIIILRALPGKTNKKYGFNLGNTRELSIIKGNMDDIEKELSTLKESQAKEQDDGNQVAGFISKLAARLTKLEATEERRKGDPTC